MKIKGKILLIITFVIYISFPNNINSASSGPNTYCSAHRFTLKETQTSLPTYCFITEDEVKYHNKNSLTFIISLYLL